MYYLLRSKPCTHGAYTLEGKGNINKITFQVSIDGKAGKCKEAGYSWGMWELRAEGNVKATEDLEGGEYPRTLEGAGK